MLDSIYHMTLKLLRNCKILPYICDFIYYLQTSLHSNTKICKPLSILMHGIISLPDAMSYVKTTMIKIILNF